MVRLMPLLAVLLSACGSEPDFDQRYAEAERRIEDRAAVMERDLEAQDKSPELRDK